MASRIAKQADENVFQNQTIVADVAALATNEVNQVSKSNKASKWKNLEDDRTIFIVAGIIAFATYIAGTKGSAILKHNPAFQAFIITDTIAMVLSYSVVLMYLYMTICKVPKNRNRYLCYGVVPKILTMLAMVFMTIAYSTRIYALLAYNI